MGLQLAVLNIAAVMLIPMVVMRAAGMTEAHLSWAVLASVRTMSSFLAIQRVLWRRKIRAVDFRAVQGAVAVDGVGNLLAGIAGTVPGSAPTTSVPLTQLTGGRRPRRGIGSDDLGGTGQRGEIHEAGANPKASRALRSARTAINRTVSRSDRRGAGASGSGPILRATW